MYDWILVYGNEEIQKKWGEYFQCLLLKSSELKKKKSSVCERESVCVCESKHLLKFTYLGSWWL